MHHAGAGTDSASNGFPQIGDHADGARILKPERRANHHLQYETYWNGKFKTSRSSGYLFAVAHLSYYGVQYIIDVCKMTDHTRSDRYHVTQAWAYATQRGEPDNQEAVGGCEAVGPLLFTLYMNSVLFLSPNQGQNGNHFISSRRVAILHTLYFVSSRLIPSHGIQGTTQTRPLKSPRSRATWFNVHGHQISGDPCTTTGMISNTCRAVDW